jgi:DNA phosphorothioation-dependent restriction protein DptG
MKIKNQQGNMVDGTDVDWITKTENWNEYECDDGTTVRLKSTVTRIFRTDEKDVSTGEYAYIVQSTNAISIRSPKEVDPVN